MSSSLLATDVRAEIFVRRRSQFADTLHRPDPHADEPLPACSESERSGAEFREAKRSSYQTWDLCQNPECFGSPTGGKLIYELSGFDDRPIRIQAFHVAVKCALMGETPIVRSDVRARLAVGENRRNSLRRGLADARDAGWLEWDESEREYGAGPLVDAIQGSESA